MPVQKISEGKYRLWVSNGRGIDGKRNRHSRVVEAKTDEAADRLYKSFEREVLGNSLPAPGNMTFKQLWDLYMRDHVRVACVPKTIEWYEQLEKRLKPAFGYMKAVAIQPSNISNFYNSLLGEISAASIKHYERGLRAVFNFGIEYKILKDNPAKIAKAPKAASKDPEIYDSDSIKPMFEALAKEELKWQALIIVTSSTAPRRGEVAGLKWTDINFDKKKYDIRRAVQYVPKKGLFVGDTKTDESKRSLSLPDLAVAQLMAWKQESRRILVKRFNRLKKHKVIEPEVLTYLDRLKNRIKNFDDEFVWCQYDGQPMLPDSISKYWRKFREKNNLPHVTFHGLRHTLATFAIGSGTDIKSISRYLGHSDVRITMQIYAQALKGTGQMIASMWNGILDQNIKWHTAGTSDKNSTSD